jgi:histidinol-phosphate aminotransferase
MKYKNLKKIYRSKPVSKSRYGLLRLDKNERNNKLDKFFINKLKSSITSEHLTSYPELNTLYANLSSHHKIEKASFLITQGIDGGLKTCIEYFSQKNKNIIILKPTFAMTKIYCKIYQCNLKEIGYDSSLNLQFDSLYKNISKKVSLIIISNPNSPTGTIVSKRNLERIIKKANKYNVKVIIDEAYYGFYNFSVINYLKKFKNLIILRTFSKAYGLAGLRIGYIISNSKIINVIGKLKPMYELNQISVLAANIILKNPKIKNNFIKEIKKGKKVLKLELEKNNIEYIDTQANFILINLKENKKKIYDKLSKKGILTTQNVINPKLKDYLRVTLGPPKEMNRLLKVLKNG